MQCTLGWEIHQSFPASVSMASDVGSGDSSSWNMNSVWYSLRNWLERASSRNSEYTRFMSLTSTSVPWKKIKACWSIVEISDARGTGFCRKSKHWSRRHEIHRDANDFVHAKRLNRKKPHLARYEQPVHDYNWVKLKKALVSGELQKNAWPRWALNLSPRYGRLILNNAINQGCMLLSSD